MAGENVKNFFGQPDASGDNPLIVKGTSKTGGGANLKTIILHGRIPDGTSKDGSTSKTEAIPIPVNGTIISIQAAINITPSNGQMELTGRINTELITNGNISFPVNNDQRVRSTVPTGNNTVSIGSHFDFIFSQNNTDSKQVASLVQEQIEGVSGFVNTGIAVANVPSHGYSNGDIIDIFGASQGDFNGLHRISIQGTNRFVFVVAPAAVTTATGTIFANSISNLIIPVNYNIIIELD